MGSRAHKKEIWEKINLQLKSDKDQYIESRSCGESNDIISVWREQLSQLRISFKYTVLIAEAG